MLNNQSGGSEELVGLILEKDRKLSEIGEKLESIEHGSQQLSLNLKGMIQDFKIDYPECSEIYINQQFSSDSVGLDTTYTIMIKLSKKISKPMQNELKNKMSTKLLMKLKDRYNLKQDSIPVYLF